MQNWRMGLLVTLLFSSCPLFAFDEPDIQLMLRFDEVSNPIAQFSPPFSRLAPVYLELGDDLSHAQMVILGPDKERYQWQVEYQLETSLTVANEGPHLDLIEWQHCTTDWQTLPAETQTHYIFPPLAAPSNCFPDVDMQQIRDEVERQGGKYWLELLKNVNQIGDYPLSEMVSQIRVRVSVKQNNDWQQLAILQILVPMGC